MPSTARLRRSGATSFPRRHPPALASPRTDQPRAAAIARSHAQDPSSGALGRSAGRRNSLRQRESLCSENFGLLAGEGQTLALGCLHLNLRSFNTTCSAPVSDLAACPTPLVLTDPLNQPGPKPAGQVTGMPKKWTASYRPNTAARTSVGASPNHSVVNSLATQIHATTNYRPAGQPATASTISIRDAVIRAANLNRVGDIQRRLLWQLLIGGVAAIADVRSF